MSAAATIKELQLGGNGGISDSKIVAAAREWQHVYNKMLAAGREWGHFRQ